MSERANILVVDDIAPNIRLVAGLLGPEGYDISFANTGKKAIEQALDNDFDLILLDIMMPDIDGITVCKTIKEHPEKRDIPVIFLTGKTDEVSVATAFEAGGVDYVHKPFNPVELIARVKTHLELKRARDTITETNRELQRALKLKNQFLSLASHDLRGPLGGVQGYLRLIEKDPGSQLGPRAHQFMESIQGMTQNMLELVSVFLDKSALELGKIELKPKFINIMDMVLPLTQLYQGLAAHKQQQLTLHSATEEIWIKADKNRLSQIIDNLLSNAVKYSPLGGHIEMHVIDHKDRLEIRVKDEGPGFREDEKHRLFGYFQRLTARPTGSESSTGIGLALTKQIVTLHGGQIRLESTWGEGATFVVELPKHDE